MKVTDARTVPPDTVKEISDLLRSGTDSEAVIARMRALGLDKIECMKLLRDLSGISLGQAKDMVHLSPAWGDCYAFDESLHDVAEQVTRRSTEDKRSAA